MASLALFFALGALCIGLTFAADTAPPTKPIVIDDGTYTSSPTSLHARWESKDKTGIAEYQYLIRQDSTSGPIIVDWTSVDLATEITRTGLSLLNGKTYFIGVRARNETGQWSKVGYSDGITVQADTVSLPPPILSYQGFGSDTLGGEGQPAYHVTNLNDSGPGSLRDALSQGNRYIVFDVGGVIETSSRIYVMGANITIDGFTAPPPGITIRNYGLKIFGKNDAHDVIVQGIRVHIINDKVGAEDGISVAAGAYNVVIDHVSIRGASDENIGINNAHDVTVSWSILAGPDNSKNMLIVNGASRVSVHHNLFIKTRQRNPQVSYDSSTNRTQDTDTTLDMRNNIIWDWGGGYGTRIRYGARANAVNNFYSSNGGDAEDALIVCKGLSSDPDCDNDTNNVARAYVNGNYSADGINLDTEGTETTPFPAAPVDTTDACTAAQQVLANAGVPVLDSTELQYLGSISLSACPGT